MILAPQESREIRYRADIDGLRAVAVVLVVAFHLNAHWSISPGLAHWIGKHISNSLAYHLATDGTDITGGFVGVDIFFVISGFLIGGIVLRELENDSFSIARFYERRVRRIFPALMAVLVFTFVVGCFALTPLELKDLAKSTLAAIFSVANLYFWKTSGYFDAPSRLKPLLHTWSLSVEEQFYLGFPILLFLLRRFLGGGYYLRFRSSSWPSHPWLQAHSAFIATQRPPSTSCKPGHGSCWSVPWLPSASSGRLHQPCPAI